MHKKLQRYFGFFIFNMRNLKCDVSLLAKQLKSVKMASALKMSRHLQTGLRCPTD